MQGDFTFELRKYNNLNTSLPSQECRSFKAIPTLLKYNRNFTTPELLASNLHLTESK